MILAQLNTPAPNPSIAWNVVLTLGILLNLAVACLALARGTKRQVTIMPDAVSKADFDRHVAENKAGHDHLYATMSGKERGLRDESTKAIGELRSQLQSTTSTMHELKGEMKQLSIQLVSVQQDLSNR